MTTDENLSALWRRKGTIASVLLVSVLAAAVVSRVLPDVYVTKSTLLVTVSQPPTFDTVQASQSLARSYANIIESPNVARRVADRLAIPTREVVATTTLEPVVETQLLTITAEARAPEEAKKRADVYGGFAVQYARGRFARATKARVSLAEGAPLPTTPDRPKPLIYTLLAAVISLPLGVGLALLHDRFDRRLGSLEGVEERFNLPALGRIPTEGRSQSSDALSEVFRLIRLNLEVATERNRVGSIAIASAAKGEERTTVAARLASASETVLLIDAGSRNPAVSQAVGAEVGIDSPGLAEYLLGSASLDEIVYPTALPNLRFVPHGGAVVDLSSLLANNRSRLSELYRGEDLTVIDCASLEDGVEASLLSPGAEGVILDLWHIGREEIEASLSTSSTHEKWPSA